MSNLAAMLPEAAAEGSMDEDAQMESDEEAGGGGGEEGEGDWSGDEYDSDSEEEEVQNPPISVLSGSCRSAPEWFCI